MPEWSFRPSGPGIWLCVADEKNRLIGLELTDEDLERGAPFRTKCVYGPIPDPPEDDEAAFMEEMAKHCRCTSGPCDGVLAGGMCDEFIDDPDDDTIWDADMTDW